tara:strand:- start:153 stop:1085 length:933 start_codon:yes stop_codon:yes gene_type:complete
MAKIFRIISLLLLITNFAYSDVFKEKYIVGQKVQNLIGLDKIQIRLSKGQWEVVESGRWSYNAFSGKNLGLVKLRNNEIVETLSLGYIDTAGKRMSDIDSYFYEVFFTDPYDGCYKRPEYYKVELYHKGATFNCFLIQHIDVNKELYNPDDKTSAYLNAKIIDWIEDNDIKIPNIVLSADHLIFSRLVSQKLYSVSHSINPKFFDGPEEKFNTEDTSEYHQLNITQHPKHKKFMEKYISKRSVFHENFEKQINIKSYQKLKLSKYILEGTEVIEKNSNDTISQIKKLNELYKAGVLTKDEFKKAKKKILD